MGVVRHFDKAHLGEGGYSFFFFVMERESVKIEGEDVQMERERGGRWGRGE